MPFLNKFNGLRSSGTLIHSIVLLCFPSRLSHQKRRYNQAISERAKAAMADPEVRQKIKDGMKRAAEERDANLNRLREAWRLASPAARDAFIAELIGDLLAGMS